MQCQRNARAGEGSPSSFLHISPNGHPIGHRWDKKVGPVFHSKRLPPSGSRLRETSTTGCRRLDIGCGRTEDADSLMPVSWWDSESVAYVVGERNVDRDRRSERLISIPRNTRFVLLKDQSQPSSWDQTLFSSLPTCILKDTMDSWG